MYQRRINSCHDNKSNIPIANLRCTIRQKKKLKVTAYYGKIFCERSESSLE